MNRSLYYLDVAEREPKGGDWRAWTDWLARESNARCWSRQEAVSDGRGGYRYSSRPMLTSEGKGMKGTGELWTYRQMMQAKRPEGYHARWRRMANFPVGAK